MRRLLLPALLAVTAVSVQAGPTPKPLPFHPAPVPGGVVVVPVGDSEQKPEVSYHGNRVLLRKEARGWMAIVGLPLSAKVGRDTLDVDGKTIAFTIQDKHYAEQHLTLKNSHLVTPDAEEEARIAQEQKLMEPVWKEWPEGLVPSLRFLPPTKGRKTSSFGLRRFYNGIARSPHGGLDIAAPAGQAVKAPADGVVVLTGDFFYSGKSVFVAHGEGVVSLLGHLSEITVKVGQRVKASERVGKVGMTGRATGPHLHWSLSLNNARVDPRLFLHP
jgi:murein DD-endopeptidase MepM/ murein hydrolase activator NlpD